MKTQGCRFRNISDLSEGLRNLHLCYAHAVYLDAMLFAVESGVGSRGSAIIPDRNGKSIHKKLGNAWRLTPESPEYREKVLETTAGQGGKMEHRWMNRRPLPRTDAWFETVWRAFRNDEIYGD